MTRTIIEYTLAAVVVVILGALVGWYFFLEKKSDGAVPPSAAREYEVPIAEQSDHPASAPSPSFLSKLRESIFGSGDGVSETPSAAFGESTVTTPAGPAAIVEQVVKRPPQLSQVHAKPIAGMSFIATPEGERLRFVERATGYVYDANLETGAVARISNTLSPKVYEVIISKSGRVIERTLDADGRISTTAHLFAASSTASATTSAATSTRLLPKDIERIAVDPKTENLFYLIRSASGVEGHQSEWGGTKATRVFSSGVLHWIPLWLSDGRVILTQNAASGVPGFAYEIVRGETRPLLRNIAGLTLLPRASGSVIFGEATSGSFNLFAQAGPTSTAMRLSIKTAADKCAWTPDLLTQSTSTGKIVTKVTRTYTALCGVPEESPAPGFLENWYRGVTHTSDTLWWVDAGSGNATLVYNPNVSVDVDRPQFNGTGGYLAFINKTDLSLWIFRVEK